MMRPFETSGPAPIVAKHCGRGRQIGRIGPIGRLQILISKAAAVWVSTNQRRCKYVASMSTQPKMKSICTTNLYVL